MYFRKSFEFKMFQKSKLISIVVLIIKFQGSICDYIKLPTIVRPSKYELSLQTKLHEGDLNFTATVQIYLTTTENVTEIQLYAVDLNIQNITVLNLDGSEIADDLPYHIISNEKFLISVPNLIESKSYILRISYSGTLHNSFVGTATSGTKFAVISFRFIKYRYFCPSFDEDDIRTVFEVSVQHHKSFKTVFNKAHVSVENHPDDTLTMKFYPTASLPTFAISIIIADFKSISISDLYTIEMHMIEKNFNSIQLISALDLAAGVLQLYNDYFNQAYKMEHVKLVIIPDIISPISTFELIIYNQYQYLISQTQRVTTSQKQAMLRLTTQAFAVSFNSKHVYEKIKV